MMNNIKIFAMGDAAGLANQLSELTGAKAVEQTSGNMLNGGSFIEEIKKFTIILKDEGGHAANSADTPLANTSSAKAFTVKTDDTGDMRSDLEQRFDILTHALNRISELLNMPEDVKLSHKDALSFEMEDMEMFADVLTALNTVIKMFEVFSNDPKRLAIFKEDLTGKVSTSHEIEPVDDFVLLAALVSNLREAKSHLEFGFYTLGMNDIISDLTAQKHGVSSITGITQAANPEDLGMSTNDLARLFGSVIKEELTSAMERVRQITSGQAEMTDLEKAAVRLETVNSGILKVALNKTNPLDGAAFENVNLKTIKGSAAFENTTLKAIKEAGIEKLWAGVSADKLKANVEAVAGDDVETYTNTEIKAAVKSKAIGTDVDLPISVKESAGVKISKRVEAMNSGVLQNVGDQSAKFAAADNRIEIPISVKESAANSKIRESIEAANRSASQSVDHLSAKFTVVDNRIEIPISVLEAANKKITASSNAVQTNTAPANVIPANDAQTSAVQTNAASANVIKANAVQINAAPANVIPANAAQTNIESAVSKQANTVQVNIIQSNTVQTNIESAASKNIVGDDSIEIPVSVMESVRKKAEKPTENKSEWAIRGNVEVKKDLTEKSDNQPAGSYQAAGKLSDGNNAATANNSLDSSQSFVKQLSDNNLKFSGIEEPVDLENTVEDTDSQDLDGVTKVETAESKASKTIDKAEKVFSTFSRLEQEAIIRQITEKMHHAIRAGAHEIRMVLRPETLGEVRMSIRVEGDVVMARMQVENKQIKSLVESNMQSLKDDLAKSNLNLGGFSVDVGSGGDRPSHEVWQEMAEKSGHRKFRADTGGLSNGSDNEHENESPVIAAGSDTGRRFGNNTFEYFI